MFYDKDCNIKILQNKTITVVGYGSQGHAQAQNLKDSGIKTYICLKNNSNKKETAIKDGFDVIEIEKAMKISDIIVILIPDEDQKDFYYDYIEKNISKNKTIIFSHGFNIHYKQIIPKNDLNIILVAPKAPGHTVRSTFKEGSGVPALIGIYQDYDKSAFDIALSYSMCIGSGKVGIILTTFKEETETDLFGEQSVLCGGVSSLILCGFETLVEAGYSPDLSYFECLHEMKLIVDLIYEGGLKNMRYSISNTAEYGDYFVTREYYYNIFKKKMRKILKNIQNGSFAKDFILDKKSSFIKLNLYREYYKNHLIESVGDKIRKLFNWKYKKIVN